MKLLQAIAVQISGMTIPVLIGLVLFRDVFLSHDPLLVVLQAHPVESLLLFAFTLVLNLGCGWVAGRLYLESDRG